MSIPYRTQRVLKRIWTAVTAVLLVGLVVWLCWVAWLQRYVVYTDNGAEIDFSLSSYGIVGERAEPPKAEEKISIFYNEGADAINVVNEMEQLNGYYITSDMFQNDMDMVLTYVERLPAETPVMIDMKGPYGSFFYDSKLKDSLTSQSTDIKAVASLIQRMKDKDLYLIARISAFRDYNFGLNHVPSGLYMLNRAGLWADSGGMYWLDPTNATTTSWIASVVLELKEMGFKEVLLTDFRFPDGQKYIFNGDKDAALQAAAKTLMDACGSDDFTLSFCVDQPAFQLPEGRCRLYLQGVDASAVGSKASMVKFEEPELRLVFLAESADTRYDTYSVLRAITISEEVEARKGN